MTCKRELWICGDIHGEIKRLIHDATHRLKIKCADILVVGDFGAGFGRPNSMNIRYREIRSVLKANDICLYTIRGNHDDPAFFDGQHDYERLHFLPDHKIVVLCGKRIYPIGGAVSTDIDLMDPLTRKSRRTINESLIKHGSSKRVWWQNEAPVQITERLPESADIIVSHEAPLSFAPMLERDKHVGESTWQQVVESRQYLNNVLKTVKAPLWFYGHYHRRYEGVVGETVYRGLDIAEMVKAVYFQGNKKVFVSGSKSISTLSSEFLELLSEAVREGSEILVGDCYGVDSAAQKYLASIGYPNVTVYCSGEEPRNYFLENGKIHSCAELAKGLTGREFQYVKDIEMCKDCDYGIALWDSKSAGTGENIKRLHALGKEMKVRLLKQLSH